jgi:hypothetical protein
MFQLFTKWWLKNMKGDDLKINKDLSGSGQGPVAGFCERDNERPILKTHWQLYVPPASIISNSAFFIHGFRMILSVNSDYFLKQR